MPFTERPSQPVVNFVALEANKIHPSFARYRDWGFSVATKTPIKYAKQVLGKQDAVKTYLNRYWVWETETWRLFASARGMTLEVITPPDFKVGEWDTFRAEAVAALHQFLDNWEAKVGLLSDLRA
jgi:hypothetical protein